MLKISRWMRALVKERDRVSCLEDCGNKRHKATRRGAEFCRHGGGQEGTIQPPNLRHTDSWQDEVGLFSKWDSESWASFAIDKAGVWQGSWGEKFNEGASRVFGENQSWGARNDEKA
jgi:hypothetical protein